MPAKGKGWDGISGLETIQPRPSGKTGMETLNKSVSKQTRPPSPTGCTRLNIS